MATFFNSATLSYNGNTTSSNIVTGELVEVLSATKTAVRGEYTTNGDVTYVISIVNTGNTNITGLTVEDDLGAYDFGTAGDTRVPLNYVDGSALYYINGVLQAAPAVTAGPPLTFTGVNIPAGGNATIVYEATPNEFAPLAPDSTIENTATLSGAGLTNDITADSVITASSEPNLTISKSLSPSTVAENGQLTYTFIIQNYGNTTTASTDDVVLSDTFNPVLSNLSVNYNGTAWTENTNYTYDEATGLFSSLTGEIVVPAATYTQDPTTGVWSVSPGVSTITVTGTV